MDATFRGPLNVYSMNRRPSILERVFPLILNVLSYYSATVRSWLSTFSANHVFVASADLNVMCLDKAADARVDSIVHFDELQ